MLTRQFTGLSEQRKASGHRRADAKVLYEGGRWRGAMYLAGYSVECSIKAKLMEMFGKKNLEELEAELKRRNLLPRDSSLFDHRIELYLRATGRMDVLKDNTPVWRSFNAANQWVPSWRYNPDLSSQPDAEGFLAAVDSLLDWINNNI